MNDFDYDAMQKKRIAQGARHKVRHTGCKLPSDNLSRKELNKMNSEVKTYKLGSPMDWKEFKKLPEDIKKKYIANLQELYHTSGAMLSEMFGIKPSTLCQYFKGHSIPNISTSEAVKSMRDQRIQATWKAFCNGVIGGGNNVKEVKEKNAEKKLEEFSEIIEKDSVTVPVKRMEMEFHDIRSMESLIEQLPKIAFPGFTKVVIYIEKEN